MTGAQNKATFHVVTPGTPDTIPSTPTYSNTQLISTQTDGLIAKKDVVFTFETDEKSEAILTFMGNAIPDTEPSETEAEKYETGVASTQGAATSGTFTRHVMIRYGSLLQGGTKIHLQIGHGYVQSESGGETNKWEEVTKPAFSFKCIKQKAGNTIVLTTGHYDDDIISTSGVPTALTGGTRGGDYAQTKAA